MRERGFLEIWIRWICNLLSTTSSRIIMNDDSTPYFTHARGLRQGDPISPMLFILAVDVLQRMVTRMNNTLQNPISTKIQESTLSLQYADDTVFICRADQPTIISFKLMLRMFSAISGLQINFSKNMFVPFNMPQGEIRDTIRILGCKSEKLHVLYLGLPLTIVAPKRADYLPLLENFEKRL